MQDDSRKRPNNLIVSLAVIGIIAVLLIAWRLFRQHSTSPTGNILNQPMPTGVPDILQKHEPPPIQP